jgi:hypothetical protein
VYIFHTLKQCCCLSIGRPQRLIPLKQTEPSFDLFPVLHISEEAFA